MHGFETTTAFVRVCSHVYVYLHMLGTKELPCSLVSLQWLFCSPKFSCLFRFQPSKLRPCSAFAVTGWAMGPSVTAVGLFHASLTVDASWPSRSGDLGPSGETFGHNTVTCPTDGLHVAVSQLSDLCQLHLERVPWQCSGPHYMKEPKRSFLGSSSKEECCFHPRSSHPNMKRVFSLPRNALEPSQRQQCISLRPRSR